MKCYILVIGLYIVLFLFGEDTFFKIHFDSFLATRNHCNINIKYQGLHCIGFSLTSLFEGFLPKLAEKFGIFIDKK